MMSGKEKIYFLLNRIDDKRVLTPAGQPILIHPANDLNNNYSIVELSQLFIKLERDEQILKVLKESTRGMSANLDPYADFEDGCYRIELLPHFDEYLSKIQQELEYQEFTGKKPTNPSKPTPSDEPKQDNQSKADVPDVVYKITYTGSREILLNNDFQLAKPTFNSENDLVFSFLFDHPNQTFSLKQIQEAIKVGITKDLHKIVENLGFKNDLKRVFFSVSKDSIQFRNSITKKDLEGLGIGRIKIT